MIVRSGRRPARSGVDRARPVRVLLASLVVLVAAACGPVSDAGPGAVAAGSAPPDPTPVAASPGPVPGVILLVSRAAGGASMEALVSGVVGISPQGCVTVAEYVLVAPFGSAVTPDGVHLAGIGDVAFGQSIAASGGVVEVDMMPVGMQPAGYEQCEAVEFAVISAP